MARSRTRREEPRGQSLAEFAGAEDGPAEEEPVEREEASPPPPPEDGHHHRAPPLGAPSMGAGYERVMTTVFRVDVEREFAELEGALKFDRPAHQLDYADLVDALDEATDNAKRAHRLFVNGKVALEVFEIDAALVMGDIRAQATNALQKEKEQGVRNKAITDADVESWMATKFADEYRANAERRAKAKRMVDHLERLSDLWKTRCAALDTMVKGSRRL